MNAKTFTEACYKEKERALEFYTSNNKSEIYQLKQKLNLSKEQDVVFNGILDTVMTDTYITLLYALDGACNLGGEFQEVFTITCEDGEVLSTCGNLEVAAYESFHERDNEGNSYDKNK